MLCSVVSINLEKNIFILSRNISSERLTLQVFLMLKHYLFIKPFAIKITNTKV